MHDQPKFKPYAPTNFSATDDRTAACRGYGCARAFAPGRDPIHGKIGDQDADVFPFPITRADLIRGQDRFMSSARRVTAVLATATE